jgi:DNA-binding transcriptional ArsR family regulator
VSAFSASGRAKAITTAQEFSEMSKAISSNRRGEGALQEVRSLCAVMAHDLRRALLLELAEGPADVGTLAQRTGESLPWVSGSLKRLLQHDLVQCRPSARRRLYSLGKHVSIKRTKRWTILNVQGSLGGGITLQLSNNRSRPPHTQNMRKEPRDR